MSLTNETRNQMLRRVRSGKIKDWLLYLVIAVLIVISVWMFAMHQARTGGSPNLPLKWLGFAGMTAIVFGYAVRACRRSWGKQEFWLVLGFLFAVHLGLGVFVLLRVPTVPLVLYAVQTGIEYAVLMVCLDLFLDS